ncbi:heterodisulfide reductase subunit B [Desulfatibacillum alkenivorans DSM 16219]|uniref:Heterodisulfide reductase subunit B n=1 Tax=Desulfatibacillum alkenivorans DSM 16219 TaxID=1121393 RepID=A0A1M6L5Z7_9BACT|nr:heterodisulfide reductase-related iron-sulfur binding cluster [Desulfatibacillum alkenivorans]SHJ66479.1 heterodisulfide reductase subunit B [Desulfatibacillum alkenivorans DSM 16219]
MANKIPKRIPYFPGCSMATTAKENNQSLNAMCQSLGYKLVELKDWNCCGSSSAHSLNHDLAVDLASRNFSLVPKGKPMLVACPSCLLRLRQAHHRLCQSYDARVRYEHKWGRPFDPTLEIIHYFDLLEHVGLEKHPHLRTLNGLSFVTYYGCMLAQPPDMQHYKAHRGLMEKALIALGAEEKPWGYGARCCGTFLSVVRPEVVTPLIDEIMVDAVQSKADCIVTACSMCHLNLEMRVTSKKKIPVMHFSELLAIALGDAGKKDWFTRHLIDPIPLLRARGIL